MVDILVLLNYKCWYIWIQIYLKQYVFIKIKKVLKLFYAISFVLFGFLSVILFFEKRLMVLFFNCNSGQTFSLHTTNSFFVLSFIRLKVVFLYSLFNLKSKLKDVHHLIPLGKETCLVVTKEKDSSRWRATQYANESKVHLLNTAAL